MSILIKADANAWRFMDIMMVFWVMYGLVFASKSFSLIEKLTTRQIIYIIFPALAYIVAKFINAISMREVGKNKRR